MSAILYDGHVLPTRLPSHVARDVGVAVAGARDRTRQAVSHEAERMGDTLVGSLAHGVPFTLSEVAEVEAGHARDVRDVRLMVATGIVATLIGIYVLATTAGLLPGLLMVVLGGGVLAYLAFNPLPDVTRNLPSAVRLVEVASLEVGVGRSAVYVGSLAGERYSVDRPASVRKIRYDAVGDVVRDEDGRVQVVDRAGRTILTLVAGKGEDVDAAVAFVRSRIPA